METKNDEKVHLKRLPKMDTELELIKTLSLALDVQLKMSSPDEEIVKSIQVTLAILPIARIL